MIDIRGTFVGTAVFEGTVDGTNYIAMVAYNLTTGAYVASVTAAANVALSCAGFRRIRVRCSAFTSGAIVVGIRATIADLSTIIEHIPATSGITATAAAGAALTLTIPAAGAGLYHYIDWILPLSLLQGAGFAGAATGVNLARDIESGLFDRFLLAPISRVSLLTGIVLSAALRVLIPTTFLLLLGFAIGLSWPGVFGLGFAALFYICFAAVAASWGAALALKFRSQQAAPLMQAGTFAAILCTTAYAPIALLTGWLKPVAQVNPVTYVLQGIRQGFIHDTGWGHTWPAILAVIGLLLAMGGFALWQMRKFNR